MIKKNLEPKAFDVKLKEKTEIIKFLKKEWVNSKENFGNLFDYRKNISDLNLDIPFYGVCLKNNENKIVGYQGLICHKSQFHKKWILNLTTWTVNKNYRQHSLKILYFILKKSKDKILTNFSANERVQKILFFLGFKEIDSSEKTYKTFHLAHHKLFNKFSFSIGKKAVEKFTNSFHRKVLEDHLNMGCSIISIKIKKTKYLGIIIIKTGLKKKQAQIIYSTNEYLIRKKKYWIQLSLIVLFNLQCLTINVDNRLSPFIVKPSKKKRRKMYAYGLKNKDLIPSRAYSEPIHIFGNFKN